MNKKYTFWEFYNYKYKNSVLLPSLDFLFLVWLIFSIVLYITVSYRPSWTIIIMTVVFTIVLTRIAILYRLYIDWKSHPYNKELSKLKKDISKCNLILNNSKLV